MVGPRGLDGRGSAGSRGRGDRGAPLARGASGFFDDDVASATQLVDTVVDQLSSSARLLVCPSARLLVCTLIRSGA